MHSHSSALTLQLNKHENHHGPLAQNRSQEGHCTYGLGHTVHESGEADCVGGEAVQAAQQHLPPNTTAFIQPMDAGIIASFKAAYKKR
ncbi:unnamed protein product [Phytophthora fragariaefolia]|uniref:Unnamed protein product n=1 Tax=Phytophthora fragariaefolia TaxID=1490495 RepID=A0A9W7CZ97_9STRA|nr:unnamed protein product [Phytophthora fragariaefolia]